MTGIDDLIICPHCLKPMGKINTMICPHCGYDERKNNDDDKSNKIFIQSYSIKPEHGGNFNL